MTTLITDLARSVAFLSRIPVPQHFFDNDHGSLTTTSRMFSVAGLLIAAPSALISFVLLLSGANALIVVILALALQVLLTGALHEDGLSDCADGFWGGKNQDRRLEIMRDSTLGTYGTLALIFSISIKIAGLYLMAQAMAPHLFALIWLSIAALSRCAMVVHWHRLPPARADGVARTVGQPSNHALFYNLGTSTAVSIGLIGMGIPLFWLIGSIFCAAISVYGFTKLSKTKINGHTGDTIGATQQLTDMALIVPFALWISS